MAYNRTLQSLANFDNLCLTDEVFEEYSLALIQYLSQKKERNPLYFQEKILEYIGSFKEKIKPFVLGNYALVFLKKNDQSGEQIDETGAKVGFFVILLQKVAYNHGFIAHTDWQPNDPVDGRCTALFNETAFIYSHSNLKPIENLNTPHNFFTSGKSSSDRDITPILNQSSIQITQ